MLKTHREVETFHFKFDHQMLVCYTHRFNEALPALLMLPAEAAMQGRLRRQPLKKNLHQQLLLSPTY